ncbi:hypothetical protein GCM10027185_45530 [Spirosoma pulveris]
MLLGASFVFVIALLKDLLPATLPYPVRTSSLVMPAREWTLSRVRNGNLISTLKDNRTGRLSAFSSSVFQRGYMANFQLNPTIYRRAYLNKGDTVASMYSNQDQERLAQLLGELEVQKAELQLVSSGRKAADVEEIIDQLALAKQELAAQNALTKRIEALYGDSLVSSQEYETAIHKRRMCELTVHANEAAYRSATTGSKPEQLQVIRSKINALQQQIQHMQNSLKELTLVAPVSGIILLKKSLAEPTEEVLLSVADQSDYVLLLPVNFLERDYVQLNQDVEIAITGTTKLAFGRIIGIDNTVQLVDGRQAFFVTALINSKNLPLVPGMLVKTTIWCQSLTLKEHLIRAGKSLFIY